MPASTSGTNGNARLFMANVDGYIGTGHCYRAGHVRIYGWTNIRAKTDEMGLGAGGVGLPCFLVTRLV